MRVKCNLGDGRYNNGMHPTANSGAFIRETPAIQRLVAAGDAERYTPRGKLKAACKTEVAFDAPLTPLKAIQS